jgi:hypothetical protein
MNIMIGTTPQVGHYIGYQEVKKIYYNEVEIYPPNNLELNDLSGFVLQEDGFLIKTDV